MFDFKLISAEQKFLFPYFCFIQFFLNHTVIIIIKRNYFIFSDNFYPIFLKISYCKCRLLEEKEDKIMELESTITRLGQEAGDKAQLLESIQSDKTALSRALTQNKDLKQQLAELQNGFVKMVNLFTK